MLVLKKETLGGADVRAIRLDPDDHTTTHLTAYRNGMWSHSYPFPTADWPKVRIEHLTDGYTENTGNPEMLAIFDPDMTSLTYAGSHGIAVPDPIDDQEPPLCQADAGLYEAGLIRITDWWLTPNQMLATVVFEQQPLGVSPDTANRIAVAFRAASDAIRNALGIDDTNAPEHVAVDYLLLCNPLAPGFGDALAAIWQQEDHYPNHIRFAMRALHEAYVNALLGSIGAALKSADLAVERVDAGAHVACTGKG